MQIGILELFRDGKWVSTGDRVEIDGDLLRVIGRADDVANVAGTKVSLAAVSELAEQVEGVRRALAVAEPSPVTGQIVCLKFALEDAAEEREVLPRLETYLRQHLRKEAWPRRWVVDEVGPEVNGKRG